MTLNRSFFLLTVAFFASGAAFIAVAVAALTPGGHASATLVAAACAAIAGAILWFEGRRDLDAVLTLVIPILGITSMCVIVYILAASDPGVFAKFAAAATAIAAVACVVATYRRQRRESSAFPNVLAANVTSGQIYETEGVQFTGYLTQGAAGRPHFVNMLLQNCFDSRRGVTVRFDAADHAKYLRFPTAHSVELGGAEVARVILPVVAPTYPGSYHLYVSISVDGTAGKRVRLWRAQEASNRTTGAETVTLAAFGVLKWGGGVRFTIGPLLDDIWGAPMPGTISETIWRPTVATVPLSESEA